VILAAEKRTTLICKKPDYSTRICFRPHRLVDVSKKLCTSKHNNNSKKTFKTNKNEWCETGTYGVVNQW